MCINKETHLPKMLQCPCFFISSFSVTSQHPGIPVYSRRCREWNWCAWGPRRGGCRSNVLHIQSYDWMWSCDNGCKTFWKISTSLRCRGKKHRNGCKWTEKEAFVFITSCFFLCAPASGRTGLHIWPFILFSISVSVAVIAARVSWPTPNRSECKIKHLEAAY